MSLVPGLGGPAAHPQREHPRAIIGGDLLPAVSRDPLPGPGLAGGRPGLIGIVFPEEEMLDAEQAEFDPQGREVMGEFRAFRALTT
ncbi:hypothetical protein ACLBWX_10705 [Methylobacterium sp. M6A4_1b]